MGKSLKISSIGLANVISVSSSRLCRGNNIAFTMIFLYDNIYQS